MANNALKSGSNGKQFDSDTSDTSEVHKVESHENVQQEDDNMSILDLPATVPPHGVRATACYRPTLESHENVEQEYQSFLNSPATTPLPRHETQNASGGPAQPAADDGDILDQPIVK